MGLSQFFIERPVFAWVIAIVVMLAGLGSIFTLSVEQYPDIAPPQVNIRATYPGASAEVLENSVTQIVEQQLTGIDGLITPAIGPTAPWWWQGANLTLPEPASLRASSGEAAQPSYRIAPMTAPCTGPHIAPHSIGGPA